MKGHTTVYAAFFCLFFVSRVINTRESVSKFIVLLSQCCVKQTEERVDILRMIQSKTQDEKLFTK